jgi:hypothetical protein
MPEWCTVLPCVCPSLFWLRSRQRVVESAAAVQGVSRAVLHQQQSMASVQPLLQRKAALEEAQVAAWGKVGSGPWSLTLATQQPLTT